MIVKEIIYIVTQFSEYKDTTILINEKRVMWSSLLFRNDARIGSYLVTTTSSWVFSMPRVVIAAVILSTLSSADNTCVVPACCDEDCCGPQTSWRMASRNCEPDVDSSGFSGTYSSDHEFGCAERHCCEGLDPSLYPEARECCGAGTKFDPSIGCCVLANGPCCLVEQNNTCTSASLSDCEIQGGVFHDPRVSCEDIDVASFCAERPQVTQEGENVTSDDVIEVSQELFDKISELEVGDNIGSIDDVGMDDYLTEFFEDFPPEGTPNALCQELVFPFDPNSPCHPITAELVDGGSYDPEGQPVDLAVDKDFVCGAGFHEVNLTATDSDGLTGFCTATVELCENNCTVPTVPPPTQTETWTKTVRCQWVGRGKSRVLSPAKLQDKYNGWKKEDFSGKKRVLNGEGPFHTIEVEKAKDFWGWDVSIAETASGDYTEDVRLECYDSDGNVCSTDNCKTYYIVRGGYHSKVEIETQGSDSAVEASARDSASFNVDGMVLFDKSVLIQNGNAVETSTSTNIGISTSISVTSGTETRIKDDTGEDNDELNVFQQKRVDKHDLLTVMASQGKATVDGKESTSKAHARVIGRAYSVVYVGITTCPAKRSRVKGGYIFGTNNDEKKRALLAKAKAFFETYGFR